MKGARCQRGRDSLWDVALEVIRMHTKPMMRTGDGACSARKTGDHAIRDLRIVEHGSRAKESSMSQRVDLKARPREPVIEYRAAFRAVLVQQISIPLQYVLVKVQ